MKGWARNAIVTRSDGQCESMVMVNGVWTRCWRRPVEIHHLITRARGGQILDEANETYHLIALCPDCHRSSDGGLAYAGNLLIDGYVTTGPDGKPRYHGSDPYLSKKYGGTR